MNYLLRHKATLHYIIFGVIGFVFLVSLAVWQYNRTIWKDDLISKLKVNSEESPVSIEEALKDYHNYVFHPVTVKGRWGKGPNFFIVGKTHRNRPGYYLMNIVTLSTGENVLVNIGWIQHANVMLKGDFEDEFVGRIRVPEPRTFYTPDNKPESSEWGCVDIEEMEKATKIPLLPFYLDHMREDTGRPPHPVPLPALPENNHKGYALLWLSLSLIWVVVVVGLIYNTKRDDDMDDQLLHHDR